MDEPLSPKMIGQMAAELSDVLEEVNRIQSNIPQIVAIRQKIQELRQNYNQIQKRVQNKVPGPNGLSNEDIERYSRQLILPGFGIDGQLKLKNTSFLIVGVGGLGCPAAQYLIGAGCIILGLMDYDVVERSNFHRQTLHTEARIGMPKTESAREALQQINPNCIIHTYNKLLNRFNALDIIAQYDVILDCSDNVATRYLLNDACVMLNKPLVSGSALQFDGQLTVYHYGEMGPCYRCLFPVPPPPETVTNCSDGGVLGAVTGTIGSLQALEAIKVAIGFGDVLAGRLLIFDGTRCIFRNIKLRARRINCDVCSTTPLITQLIDYEIFCNMHASDKDFALDLIPDDERITATDYGNIQTEEHVLIDVRPKGEFEICELPAAINVPMKQLMDDKYMENLTAQLGNDDVPVYVVCRRGNDSQIAVRHLRDKYPRRKIQDIIGGLHAWHKEVDPNFPIY